MHFILVFLTRLSALILQSQLQEQPTISSFTAHIWGTILSTCKNI